MTEYGRLRLLRSKAAYALIARREEPAATIFIVLRAAAEEARMDCEIARLTLEQHRDVHARTN
jgi:hypothetical protein